MIDEQFLQSLGFIIVGGAVFALLGRLIRMPTIVAYLFAGLFLGPVSGLVETSPALELISEIGIALLLFLVGLELSFEKIAKVGKVAMVAGIGQVVLTALGGLLFCYLLGFPFMESLFLATGLTFSSTVVVVKLLDEKKELNSLYGRIAVGIFLVQDLVVILILTFLAGFSGEETKIGNLAWGFFKAFGGMALLLAAVLTASRYLLPKPFAWASGSPETGFIWSLSWCFLAVLAAEWLHLSLEIGAFLAGISLAQLPYNEDLRRRVHPLMNFLIAVFFISLGMRIEPQAALNTMGGTVLLSLFVLIGNPVIFLWIITRMGYSEKTSFQTSVTVAQISEFSFIFAAMGVSRGLIDDTILSVTAMVGVITIAISAYMILYMEQLYSWARRWKLLGIFKAPPSDPPGLEGGHHVMRDHVILVGMNTLGRELARRLAQEGEAVLAVDTDPRKLANLPCRTLLGNVEYYSVLEEAGLPHAKLLVSCLHIESTNDLLAYRCKQHNIPCSINAIDLTVIDNLLAMNVNYLMIPKVDGVKLQNRELRNLGFLAK